MTLFAIFERPTNSVPIAVPETFSWFAFLLPPVFALRHGLWLELGAYALTLVALGLLKPYIGGSAAFWLYAVLALWLGFAAPGVLRAKLTRTGWRHRDDIIAPNADLAALTFLDRP
ncbi:DUF2628 domain-containing protein [Devosia sp.]|uniref:DUF2628 domain-containing protein n=1 Tax=Devosia sp. TaxID=1871048 RepID=UPI00326354C1